MGFFDNLAIKGRWKQLDSELTVVGQAVMELPEPLKFQLGSRLNDEIEDWKRPVMQGVLSDKEAKKRNCEAAREMGLEQIRMARMANGGEYVLEGAAKWLVAAEKETEGASNEWFRTMNVQLREFIKNALLKSGHY